MIQLETGKERLKVYIINKILSTFWKYQQEHFGREITSKRWTFTVGRFHPEAFGFESAIKELAEMGYVFFDYKTMQFGLTDRGIEFCKENEDQLNLTNVFTF
ncbi:MAG: hypothetical protein SFU91_03810 [Chloroherpetonaceae bacterium]|nr:hypothetical protein [Chloroherpetonaceae bacterium]